MPDLESRADQSTRQRLLLAVSLGAAAGLEIWWLTAYGFALHLAWYGLAWLVLSHICLGLATGAAAGYARWWKVGLTLGMGFSLPAALVAHALGLEWMPYGPAVLVQCLATAFAIAWVANRIFPYEAVPASQRMPRAVRPGSGGFRDSAGTPKDTAKQRLAKANACLERLDAERTRRRDPAFGKSTEDRVVWWELLDLELQDIDERVSRAGRVGDEGTGPSRQPGGGA